MTRAEAKALGLKRFNTGRPCSKGHSSEYLVSNATCVTCIKIKNRIKDKRTRRLVKLKVMKIKNDIGVYKDKERLRLKNKKHKRRAAEHATGVGSINKREVDALLTKQNNICAYCTKNITTGHTIDHFIPLSRGGEHKISNIRLACFHCNVDKGAKLYPTEWHGRKETLGDMKCKVLLSPSAEMSINSPHCRFGP